MMIFGMLSRCAGEHSSRNAYLGTGAWARWHGRGLLLVPAVVEGG